MPITFTGDIPSATERILTGLHSLDLSVADSLGNKGWPLRSLSEVYGPKSVGKTSFCLSLMGIIAASTHKNCTVLDLEIQDRNTVEQILMKSGFSKELHYIMTRQGESPEKTLGRFTDKMFEKNPDIALLDSIGAYQPNAVLDGDIGDRNVGQKALEMGQLSSRLMRGLQLADKPNAIFMTNHVHPNIGYMAIGNTTTGGVTKKYLSHLRVNLTQAFFNKYVVHFGDSWLVKGKIDNNRFGFSNKEFYVFFVGGEGIHHGLTAMWECIIYGYADVSSKKIQNSTTVTMDGQSFGKMGIIFRDRNNEPERFIPFINRLKAKELDSSLPDDEKENEDDNRDENQDDNQDDGNKDESKNNNKNISLSRNKKKKGNHAT